MKTMVLMKTYQPAGCLYSGAVPAETLRKIITPESIDSTHEKNMVLDSVYETYKEVVRQDDTEIDISAVVLSVRSEDMPTISDNGETVTVSYDSEKSFAEAVAGGNRILHAEDDRTFLVPVVFLFDITDAEKWLIQSVMGVPCGNDYDAVHDTPEMRCHIISRCLNAAENSPFFGMLPMVGEKAESGKISQGVLSRALLPMLKDSGERGIFRPLSESRKTGIILRILVNYFRAVKTVYPRKWDSMTRAELEKWMDALPEVYRKCFAEKDMTADNIAAVLKSVEGASDGSHIEAHHNIADES